MMLQSFYHYYAHLFYGSSIPNCIYMDFAQTRIGISVKKCIRHLVKIEIIEQSEQKI